MLTFTELEIAAHIAEPKVVVNAVQPVRLIHSPKPYRADTEWRVDLRGLTNGFSYRLIGNGGISRARGFSVILVCAVPNTNQDFFRLLRYDCSSVPHTNHLEGNTCSGCHIHRATERYQLADLNEDGHAETTDDFHNFVGAVACIWKTCSIIGEFALQATITSEVL